jgi:hypothetical protein
MLKKSCLAFIILSFIFSCTKNETEELVPVSNTDCLVNKSEVLYSDILKQKRDGFFKLTQYFSADGKFKNAQADAVFFGSEPGKSLELKSYKFNGQTSSFAINGISIVSPKQQNQSAKWQIVLQDNTAIDLCVSALPKVILLDKIVNPTKSKDWSISLDITNSNADRIAFADNILFSENNSDLVHIVYANEKAFTKTFQASYMDSYMEKQRLFGTKEIKLAASAEKDYLVSVKNKKIHISVENITEKTIPVY